MGSKLIISFAVISLALLVLRLWYYKLSVKDDKVIERVYTGSGWFDFLIPVKVFFPISIKFKDDVQTRALKKKANNFLYAFYISVAITVIMLSIF
ncbi:MAG: hypothetical protein KGM98_02455 [Bacteroidota bacterium]|nr:hypothetical protein [Bacteroidota bacterium]